MAIQLVNLGNTANDGTGDDLREAFVKVNANFNELDLRDDEQTTVTNLGATGEGLFKESFTFYRDSIKSNIETIFNKHSTIKSGFASHAAARTSAKIKRPSASVLPISTVFPFLAVKYFI